MTAAAVRKTSQENIHLEGKSAYFTTLFSLSGKKLSAQVQSEPEFVGFFFYKNLFTYYLPGARGHLMKDTQAGDLNR